jgi:hypothetical protein
MIGKPVMLPRSGLVVRNAGDLLTTMAKQTEVKRSPHGVSGGIV